MATAIYPGSFDPITYGHIDVIKRAARLFDQVIVAVGAHANKSPLFDQATRVQLAQCALSDINHVSVSAFDGLLVDFAQSRQAHVMLRSVRNASDFDDEAQMAAMNQQLDTTIETIFLMPTPAYRAISSSLVRQIARLGGDVSHFVPPEVTQAIALIADSV